VVRSSRSIATFVKQGLRRVFGPPIRGLSKTGKIFQTLWDAAQIQDQQRDYYRKIGDIAIQLHESSQLKDPRIEKLVARLRRNEGLMARLENFLDEQVRRRSSLETPGLADSVKALGPNASEDRLPQV